MSGSAPDVRLPGGPPREPEIWLDIWRDADGPSRARRVALSESLTRVGGGDADVSLSLGELPSHLEPAHESDQLHFWNRPPRVLYFGRGPKPTCDGVAFDERALAPGERVEWAGHTLLFGGEGAPAAARASARQPVAAAAPSRASARERVRPGPRPPSMGAGSFILMQLGSFLLFCLLVASILVVLRMKGVSIDAWIDRLLPG